MVVAYLRTHCEDRNRRLAIFWDYGSVHQKDESGMRTPAEDAAFRSALSVMSDVYATPAAAAIWRSAISLRAHGFTWESHASTAGRSP